MENLLEWLPLLLPVLSAVFGLITFIIARCSSSRKKKLTQAEQETDLFKYMVKVIKNTEVFSKLLRGITKGELAVWKHDDVLDKIEMYAKGCQYSWFVREEWSLKIDEYISDANIASGKKQMPSNHLGDEEE